MRHLMLCALAAMFSFACSPAPERPVGDDGAPAGQAAAERVANAAEVGSDLVVYKSPTCGCCNGWVEHLREAGHEVETVNVPEYTDLAARKTEEGVPADLGSCHTAVVDGYVVEGHVPAEVIERMLRERPDIRGLAVPGMPIGSPGMEGPNPQPYEVIAFTEDGEQSVYQRIDPRE